MKRFLSAIIAFTMILTLTAACSAADPDSATDTGAADTAESFTLTTQIGNPTMTVNGTEKPIDAEGSVPVVVNDRTLLPVRAVVEEMGGTVEWKESTEQVTLTRGNDVIKMNIGSEKVTLNGEEHTLDAAPTLINDRTMLPIRFIAESFGFTVAWTEETQTVTITAAADSGKDSENNSSEPTDENGGKTQAEASADLTQTESQKQAEQSSSAKTENNNAAKTKKNTVIGAFSSLMDKLSAARVEAADLAK